MRPLLFVTLAAVHIRVPTDQWKKRLVPTRVEGLERALQVAVGACLYQLTLVRILVASSAIPIQSDEAMLARRQHLHVGVRVALRARELEMLPVHLQSDESVVEVVATGGSGSRERDITREREALPVVLGVARGAARRTRCNQSVRRASTRARAPRTAGRATAAGRRPPR
jgi:hypothetical protein